jgi:tetratricopeptide (TPR) repeat protein
MKLEFESSASTYSPVETDFFNDVNNNGKSAEVAEMLNAGIKAAQEGRRAEARNFLLLVTEKDSENENAWLWLASISEYPEELLVFLNSVLKINPNNERAIEWAKATKTLLSKTFVQRGIDASKEIQKDFAKQCFLQAIVHDNQNEMAWLWLASVSDSEEEKASYLQKVLNINPENATAQASLKSIKKQKADLLLEKAFAAAVEEENGQALERIQEVLKHLPEMEDAWVLKSFLMSSRSEKIKCFEKVLEINPENNLAQANLTFLRSMESKAETEEFELEALEVSNETMPEDEPSLEFEVFENEQSFSEEIIEDKNPTEELEFPEYSVEEENEFVESKVESASQAELEETEASSDFAETKDFAFEAEEDFNRQPELSSVSINSQETEETFDDKAIHETQFAEEKLPELSEAETEINFDSGEVQELSQVYAYQESVEEDLTVEDVSYAIHETEPAYFYEDSEAELETENSVSGETESSVFELEADEFYSAVEAKDDFVVETENVESNLVEVELNAAEEDLFFPEETEEFVSAEAAEENNFQAEVSPCPFCSHENESQAFVCRSCRAVVSLSDLEALLAAQEADMEIVGEAIRRIDMEKMNRDLEADELRLIAIGYFNLQNPKKGILYLNEAARKNPDDIVLSSQVNALKIRLAEIEKQKSIHSSMPKNMTILVVDDSATVRKLISGKLEKSGHEVD